MKDLDVLVKALVRIFFCLVHRALFEKAFRFNLVLLFATWICPRWRFVVVTLDLLPHTHFSKVKANDVASICQLIVHNKTIETLRLCNVGFDTDHIERIAVSLGQNRTITHFACHGSSVIVL